VAADDRDVVVVPIDLGHNLSLAVGHRSSPSGCGAFRGPSRRSDHMPLAWRDQ
jgi:hypothetical protein